MLARELQAMIQDSFSEAVVTVDSEDQVHFNAHIISSFFVGKSLIERQRLVYKVVNEHIVNGTIHALSLKTFTPEEWQGRLP